MTKIICKECKSEMKIEDKDFSLIKGVGVFKCSNCGYLNEDTSMLESSISKVYWEIKEKDK